MKAIALLFSLFDKKAYGSYIELENQGESDRLICLTLSKSDVSDGLLYETLRVACFPGGIRLRPSHNT
jgi:hypothetical protein